MSDALHLADVALADLRAQLSALGELRVVHQKLMAGETCLHETSEIVDRIKERHGFGSTIFLGNVRISTTAVAEGTAHRALGTSANAKITQQVYHRGESFRGVTHTIGKEWIIVYVPLRDERDHIVGMLAAYRELVDFLDDLSALNFIGEAVLLHDRDGVIMDLNRSASDMLSSPREQVLSRPLQRFTITEDGAPLDPKWLGSVHELTTIICHWVRDDQRSFPVSLAVRPTPRDHTAPLLTIVRDYTEQYEAQAQLKEVNDRLRQVNSSLEGKVEERTQELHNTYALQSEILDSLFEGVISFNAQGVILSANRSAGRILGLESARLINQTIRDVLPGWRFDKETNGLQLIKHTRADQQALRLQIQSNRLSGALPQVERYNASFRDVTLQHQREQDLRRIQRMDAVGKLVSGIAHDFNNLLTIILGTATVMYQDVAEEASDQPSDQLSELMLCAQDIIHAANRGTDLTKKLLSFARGSSTDAEVCQSQLVIGEMHRLLSKTLTHRVTLNLSLDPETWPIYVDRSGLEDALLNLCINAMHAITDKGTISISTRNISSDATATLNLPAKDYVCITVKDSGAGMSEEVMTRIFEPYYSTKGKGGTGLGLTQVYGFTQGAQGEVRVSSKLNEGSSFMLYLPRTMNDRGDAELLDEAPQSTQALSILLVDDEEMIRKYLSRVLKNSGHHVVQACDATEAIRCLERDQVDLMVSDVMMPGRDGFELAQEVLERFPSVKIQMISGYYDQKTLPKGLPAWLKDQLISKPFKPEVLIERVNQLFCAEK